jgi:hypothetical protein
MLRRLNELLRQLGADLDDVVKFNLFNVDGRTKASWERSALIRTSHYREPGPTATITVPLLWPTGLMTKSDVIATRGVDGSRLVSDPSAPQPERTGVAPDHARATLILVPPAASAGGAIIP